MTGAQRTRPDSFRSNPTAAFPPFLSRFEGSIPMIRTTLLLSFLTLVAVGQAPANDNPTGATTVFDGINPSAPLGLDGSTFTNAGATLTPGFVACTGTGTVDVWFLYTATTTGPCVFQTCLPAGFTQVGTGTDTNLDIFDDTGVGGLPGTKLVCDDDACNLQGLASSAVANVTAGSNYYARVNAFSAATLLSWYLSVVPTDATTADPIQGEDCATTIAVLPSTTNGIAQGNTIGALVSAPSGTCATILGTDVDVWWIYVPPATGTILLSRDAADAGIDNAERSGASKLGVYDGSGGCGALINVLCTGTTSNNSFPVSGGVVYYIRAASLVGTQQGSFTITWNLILPPSNDDCTGATAVLDGVNPAVGTFNNIGGLDDAGYSAAACAAGAIGSKGVWFSYVASVTGNITVQTCTPTGKTAGTLTDTVLEIFDNCGATFTSVACSDNSCTNLSSAAFAATAGNAYWFRVSSKTITAAGSFYVEVVLPPVNDDCAGATAVVDGVNPAVGTYSNIGATDDAGYSAAACAAGAIGSKGVWFAYTATTTGNTSVATCTPGTVTAGSLTDTIVEIFDNCGVTFTAVACNDNSCTNLSNVSFASTAGSTYWIRVSSKTITAAGTFYLQINPAPTNDECSGALSIGLGVNGPFLHLGATTSAPAPTCSTNTNDVWFAFTAPDSGTLKINTCGSNFDTILSVYDATCTGVSLACDDDDLNNLGPCATTQTLNSFLTVPVTAGTTYMIRVGNFSALTFGQFMLQLSYKFSFSMTKPTPLDVQLKDFAGTPGNLFLNAITLNQGAFPNGWFYGVDIPVQELLAEVNLGTPFFGVLDGLGGFTQTYTGLPFIGLTFYTRAVEFTLGGIFVQTSDAVAWTI